MGVGWVDRSEAESARLAAGADSEVKGNVFNYLREKEQAAMRDWGVLKCM